MGEDVRDVYYATQRAIYSVTDQNKMHTTLFVENSIKKSPIEHQNCYSFNFLATVSILRMKTCSDVIIYTVILNLCEILRLK